MRLWADLLSEMNLKALNQVARMSEDDLIDLHFTAGMSIGNNFVYPRNDKLLQSCREVSGRHVPSLGTDAHGHHPTIVEEVTGNPQVEGGHMNNIQRFLLPALILGLTLFVPVQLIAGEYQVTRVIDGDTIKVEDGSKKITVILLAGIDAPETSKIMNDPGQPYGQRAMKHLAILVANQTVDVKSYGFDGDGRVLGEVFFEDRNINLQMVKAGLAEVYRGNQHRGRTWDHTGRPRRRPRLLSGVFGCRVTSTSPEGVEEDARELSSPISSHGPHPDVHSTDKSIDDPERDKSNHNQHDQCWDSCDCPLHHENNHRCEWDFDVSYNDFPIVC